MMWSSSDGVPQDETAGEDVCFAVVGLYVCLVLCFWPVCPVGLVAQLGLAASFVWVLVVVVHGVVLGDSGSF